jgi:hypothetical protein
MEPRREEPTTTTPRPEEKQKRFRLIKLEERIAPGGGHTKICPTDGCTHKNCGTGTTLSIE